MKGILLDTFNLALTGFLILLNGCFVASKCALVKVNKGMIVTMQKDKKLYASLALWLNKRLRTAPPVCQMGFEIIFPALSLITEPE